MGWLKNYCTLSRFEFLPATSVAILIGIFLGAGSFYELTNIAVLVHIFEGLIIFYILFNTGFMVNCWSDWKVDEKYKSRLAKAVEEIGRRNLGILVIIHLLIAFILAIHLTISINKIEIFALVGIGVFLGVGYSVEPIRFKSRGVFHSVMAIPVFAIPGTFSYYLVGEFSLNIFTFGFILLVIGITTYHYALVLISQTEDFPEDCETGIKTPAVIWGIKKTVLISYSLLIFGSTFNITAFIVFFLLLNNYFLLFVILLIFAELFPIYTIAKLNKIDVQDELLKRIRLEMKNYPKWHGVPLCTIMLGSAIILLLRTIS
ncbi:MAG: UbiA family prenyltransferase [Candidatus Thermoplasmatota archaeon]